MVAVSLHELHSKGLPGWLKSPAEAATNCMCPEDHNCRMAELVMCLVPCTLSAYAVRDTGQANGKMYDSGFNYPVRAFPLVYYKKIAW